MKKLTLSETWTLCLQMWKWIAGQVKKGRTETGALKKEWLLEHDWGDGELVNNCFFCEWALGKDDAETYSYGGCPNRCPASKIDENFSCRNIEYDYYDCPIKFYQKLVRLNKIRKKQGMRKSITKDCNAKRNM